MVQHYCPKCFNATVKMNEKGVVQVIINGLKMDRGQFLFNKAKETPQEIETRAIQKLEEFFKWYSTFDNRDPIKVIQMLSSDYSCESHCKLPMNTFFPIVGDLLSEEKLIEVLNRLGEKFNMEIKLKNDEDK
jgi:hypothetical protein